MNDKKPMNSTPSPHIGKLSESLEDYIEIIHNLIKDHKVARVRDIANAKDVKMSSVVSALKRLDQEGLVKHEAREYVELTDAGTDLAQRLIKRHNFLTRFLVEVLLVDHQTAESDACSMEHAISAETMNRLYSFAEFLRSQFDDLSQIVDEFKQYDINKEKEND